MKGFIIYEDYRGKKVVEAVKLGVVNYTCKSASSDDDWVSELSGIRTTSTQASCNEEDTYDFETGALIALMKMCGVDKVVRACNEAFSEDTFKTYATIYERELNELKKEKDKLAMEILTKDKYVEAAHTARDKAINCSIERGKKIKELEEENEKLKLDCEKLQHGYIDTDIIFCGGRQNGKQFTALVNLFKKIDQKKVDAAYKEAYNTTLPVWQKEVLKQMYDVYKESKEKTELPTKREEMWDDILKEGRTPVYVRREYIHAFLEECQVSGIKWVTGKMPLETMPFYMSKGCDGIYFFVATSLDISKSTPGSKEFRLVMSWWKTASDEEARNSVKYIAPMRWDLFKKGRRIIRVTSDKLDEFMKECTNKLGCIMKPNLKRYKDFTHTFIMISDYHYDNKPTIHIMSPEDLVRNQHENPKKYSDKKIVDWEDVR